MLFTPPDRFVGRHPFTVSYISILAFLKTGMRGMSNRDRSEISRQRGPFHSSDIAAGGVPVYSHPGNPEQVMFAAIDGLPTDACSFVQTSVPLVHCALDRG
tara:strand:+ start:460 stop:762 length:303 start_codon:yes stop_codon:yes gene_type:complete